MEVEVAHLKEEMDIQENLQQAGMDFCAGKLEGLDCVVVRCGVGKVNAAICAQILIDKFQVTHIINTGIAGSLNNDIDICDIVVSRDAVQYDMDVIAFGYDRGEIPQLGLRFFEADPTLIHAVEQSVERGEHPTGLFKGRVATGDRFVADDAVKADIVKDFGALCCEMEGAAIAQCATLNKVPFVIIRAISDKADGSREMLYDKFEGKAAATCAQIVKAVAAQLKAIQE